MDWWREKKKEKKKKEKKRTLERGAMLLEELIECCDGKSNPIKFFSDHQILKATNNFSQSNQFSELSSIIYKCDSGKDESQPMILTKGKFFGYRQEKFCRDIAISSMVSGHKNFMKLVGCCLDFDYPVMVYHGVKKHYHLNYIISQQTWKRRMKIAEDIATSLAYLHTAFPRPFVYRSLIPDNVLLDEDGVAKLSDFSDCVSIPKGETFVKVHRNYCGDIYMDSKYLTDGVVSVETDVYAFGILIMQVLLHGFVFNQLLIRRITIRKEISDGYDTDDIFGREDARRYIQKDRLELMKKRKMQEIADPEMLKMMGEISEKSFVK